MKLDIDATEVAEQLADCKPGESKLITITVGSNDGQTITGEATAVEYAEDEEDEDDPEGETEDEEEDDEEEAMAHRKGKKMPKAILIMAGK